MLFSAQEFLQRSDKIRICFFVLFFYSFRLLEFVLRRRKNSLKAAFYLHNAVLGRLSNALQVKLYDSSYSPLTVSHVYESIPIHIYSSYVVWIWSCSCICLWNKLNKFFHHSVFLLSLYFFAFIFHTLLLHL